MDTSDVVLRVYLVKLPERLTGHHVETCGHEQAVRYESHGTKKHEQC